MVRVSWEFLLREEVIDSKEKEGAFIGEIKRFLT